MSVLGKDLLDGIRKANQVQTLAERNALLLTTIKRLLDAHHSDDSWEWPLAELQARAQLRRAENEAAGRKGASAFPGERSGRVPTAFHPVTGEAVEVAAPAPCAVCGDYCESPVQELG